MALTVSPARVGKGGTAIFTITASSVAAQPIVVNYAMSGNAGLGSDYELSGTLGQAIIAQGGSAATIDLTVITTKTKGKEKATMGLLEGSGYKLPGPPKKKKVKPPQATVTIQNR
jgi:hypothetical protein